MTATGPSQLESGLRADTSSLSARSSVATQTAHSARVICSGPKNRISFWTQIVLVYLIIIVSITHLSLRSPDRELWLILLSSSIGYILPSPGLKFAKAPNVAGGSVIGFSGGSELFPSVGLDELDSAKKK